MSLFALGVGLAIVIGRLRGGRLRSLAVVDLRASYLLWLAAGLQLALVVLPASVRAAADRPLLMAAYTLVAAWVVGNATRNERLRGALVVIACGWLLNVAVMLPNGGMPVSLWAMDVAGLAADEPIVDGNLYKHVVANDDTVLGFLGDVIPLPLVGPLRKAISLGDLVLVFGIGLFIVRAMSDPTRGIGTSPLPRPSIGEEVIA